MASTRNGVCSSVWEWNHNVKVALLFTCLRSIATGIWGFAVLSGYLKVLTGKNSQVGLAEGMQGLGQALVAIPAGLLADKFSREWVLHRASLIGALSIAGIVLSLYFGGEHEFMYFSIFVCLWGCFTGATNAPLEAIFADSLTSSDRTKFLQYKYSIMVFSRAAGPVTSVILFLLIGDSWTLKELKIVLTVGCGLSLPAVLLLVYFKDSEALGLESEANAGAAGEEHPYTALEDSSTDDNVEIDTSLVAVNTAKRDSSSMFWVPLIVEVSDIIVGIASGMTVKFFPLFFKEETIMSPVEVNVLFVMSPLSVAVSAFFTRRLAGKIGRVQAVMCAATPGIVLLFSMYWMGRGYDLTQSGSVPLWRNRKVIIPVYLLRTALINSSRPLKKAILMDYVPKKRRGLWNALDSVMAFGWSGSAILGGFLVDRYGYGETFLYTAVLQGIGYLITASLLMFVKR